jgi:hypothetical protein
MNQWINLDTSKLADQFEKQDNHFIKMMLSPNDVPDAVRVSKDGCNVTVEFRFIPIKEDRFEDEIKHGLIFEVGKKTGRIYNVRIDFSIIELPNNTCDLTIRPDDMSFAIDTFIKEQERKTKNLKKYEATKLVFTSYSEQLNHSLAHG